MKEIYEKTRGRRACDMQASMLAYFLRVNPAYGAEQLRFCVKVRGNKLLGCWARVLGEAGQIVWTKELEKVCAEALMDEEAELAADAPEALQLHGSAEARRNLIEALGAKWVAAKKRDNQENDVQQPKNPQEHREVAIVRALTEALGWVLSDAELMKVAGLVRGDHGKQAIEEYKAGRAGKITVQMSVGEDGGMHAYILGLWMNSLEAVERKMAQFPNGTVFTLTWGGPEDRDVNRAKLREWAKLQGVMVEN
jgi:hypothetical protein